ncbi:MAG: hypothetical protein WEA58_07425 [Balneolaceae bacterium]
MRYIISSSIGILILLLTFTSCSDVTSFDEGYIPFSWENGETIIEADDSDLSASVRDRLQKSAEVLAVNHVISEDSTQIDIPDKLVELFYNGLVHLANSNFSEAKEVIHEKEINAKSSFRMKEILVFPDTTEAAELIEHWQNKEAMTGNSEVDSLINEYGISVISFSELKSMPFAMVNMKTDKLINVLPVAAKFRQIEGVTNAEGNGQFSIMGGGSTIYADIMEYFLRFQFGSRWGDCLENCIGEFNIYKDGTVEVVK